MYHVRMGYVHYKENSMRVTQYHMTALVGTKTKDGLDYLVNRNFRVNKESITEPHHLIVFRRDPVNNRLDPYMTWLRGRPITTLKGRQWNAHAWRLFNDAKGNVNDTGSTITKGTAK